MLSYIKKLDPRKESPLATATTIPAQEEKEEEMKAPVLSPEDESFLSTALESADVETVILEGGGSRIATGASTPVVAEDSLESKHGHRTEEWREALTSRWEGLKRGASQREGKKGKENSSPSSSSLGPSTTTAEGVSKKKEKKKISKGKSKEKEEEVDKEDELTSALERLNLAAEDGRAFSLSPGTRALLTRFTQIFKDILTGVPTAYSDLTDLLNSSSSQLEETFTNLPGFMQRLIKTLPTKLSRNLSPELLRSAAAAPVAEFTMPGLKEIVQKPGLLMGLLKGVVNVLKTRFPMLLGANAALGMALFVVLLILWYCHKRGKEVRLDEEEKMRAADVAKREAEIVAGSTGVEGDLQGGCQL